MRGKFADGNDRHHVDCGNEQKQQEIPCRQPQRRFSDRGNDEPANCRTRGIGKVKDCPSPAEIGNPAPAVGEDVLIEIVRRPEDPSGKTGENTKRSGVLYALVFEKKQQEIKKRSCEQACFHKSPGGKMPEEEPGGSVKKRHGSKRRNVIERRDFQTPVGGEKYRDEYAGQRGGENIQSLDEEELALVGREMLHVVMRVWRTDVRITSAFCTIPEFEAHPDR